MPRLVLDFDRPDVAVADFTAALQTQVRLVSGVMATMGVPAARVRWVIAELRAGSAYAVVDAQVLDGDVYESDVDRAVAATGEGLRALSARHERPAYFTDESLQLSRELMRLLGESSMGRGALGFGTIRIAPAPQVAVHVGALIESDERSIGSIEGVINGISGQDGSYQIRIRDRLRGSVVRCVIPPALLPRALGAFERRVIVRGIVWTRPNGTAHRIEVRDIEEIPADDLLPSADEVRGILRGFDRADAD